MTAKTPEIRAELPVAAVLPELVDALRSHGVAVLVAPAGSGKTTMVPPALLDAGLLGDGKLVMLQPRRVAARSTARWMAQQRGAAVGQEIGYSVRFERRTGPRTRIEVVTEGVLTRRLLADPFLEGVSCVVLDEFHERSLQGDLALAMLDEVRQQVRPDLRIVVMSATLDAASVAEYLGGAPVIQSDGRAFPVQVHYRPRGSSQRLSEAVTAAVIAEVAKLRAAGDVGHVLAFLPGVASIQRAVTRLAERLDRPVLPLHGRLQSAAQDAVIQPHGAPRVIVATNIAETSLTIDGVVSVVDSGKEKQARVDPVLGLSRLELRSISRASAEQRAGRAGRTRPGRCVRLWSELDHAALPAFTAPEIQRADLAPAILQVMAWGQDASRLRWFQPPPADEVERALGLLRLLGLTDKDGLTRIGRAAAGIPCHPRLARLLWDGAASGELPWAVDVAALVETGEVLATGHDVRGDDDVSLRLDLLRQAMAGGGRPRWRAFGLSRSAGERFAVTRAALFREARAGLTNVGSGHGDGDRKPRKRRDSGPAAAASRLFRNAFADRVAQRVRDGEHLRLASGHGAELGRDSRAKGAELVFAVSMRAGQRGERARHVIDIACPADVAHLATNERARVWFDEDAERVQAEQQEVLGALILRSRRIPVPADQGEVLLAEAARAKPTRAFTIDRETGALLDRLAFLRCRMPQRRLPTFACLRAPDADAEEAPDIIAAACVGQRSFAGLRKVALAPLMRGLLGHYGQELDRFAPARLELENGRSFRVRYDSEAPVLAARIQHLFGVRALPKVAGGNVAIQVHLLAPNGRPAQITTDLASFWANSYAAVRKDLRGRYPKHAWPEKP